MSEFQVNVGGHEIGVTQSDEHTFIVRLPDKTIHLVRKQDNEGANHWFEEGKDNETPQLSDLGTAIEKHLLSN